jgi:ribonuclease HI
MTDMLLFTDGSVNPQLKIGYGAYLPVPDQTVSIDSLKMKVIVKRFEKTSSTKLQNSLPLRSPVTL